MNKTNDNFASKYAMLLAVIGSAIGVGNYLRFPALFAKFGGFFLVPYLIFFVLIGLPGLYIEWNLGLLAKKLNCHSLVTLLELSFPKMKYVKYLGIIVIFSVLLGTGYYLYIESWMLGYSVFSLCNVFSKLSPEELAKFYINYINFHGSLTITVVGIGAVILSLFLNFILTIKGVKNGIGKFMLYAVPCIFLLSILMIVKLFYTPNFIDGIKFMLRGNPHDLLNLKMWAAAASQIFFSLSIGMGLTFVYASFSPDKIDIVKDSTISAFANSFTEVFLASLIIIPISFLSFGEKTIEILNQSTIGFGMITIPSVFSNLPLSNILCFLWYILLFLACLSSTIADFQLLNVFFCERLQIKKISGLTIISLIILFCIVLCIINIKTIDMFDFILCSLGTPLSTLITLIMVFMFVKSFWESLDKNTNMNKKFSKILILICPITILGVITLMMCEIKSSMLLDMSLSCIFVRISAVLLLYFIYWVAHWNIFTKEDFLELL